MIRKYSEEDVEWLRLVARYKWKSDERYSCLQCSHKKYSTGKSPYSRKCTMCKYEESAISGTLFHGMRIPISKAMSILESLMRSTAEYVDHIFDTPHKKKKFMEGKLPVQRGLLRVSTTELARRHRIQQKTAWSFLNKIMEQLDDREFDEDDVEEMGQQYVNFRSWYKWIKTERTAGYAALFMLVLTFNVQDDDYSRAMKGVLKSLIETTHGDDGESEVI
jgi:hypothetical protein